MHENPQTRRIFLRLAAAAAASTLIPTDGIFPVFEELPYEDASKTYGIIQLSQPHLRAGRQWVEVVGYADNYQFLVRPLQSTHTLRLPIESVHIETLPTWHVRQNSRIGIRNDWDTLVPYVPLIGAGHMRIDIGKGDLLSKQLPLIQAAEKHNIHTLLVFNPQKWSGEAQLISLLQPLLYLLTKYTHIALELGNEPDNTGIPFWEHHDLASFARFIKVASEYIFMHRPDIPVIIGANAYATSIPILKYYLTQEKVRTNKCLFALHGYETVEEVDKMIQAMGHITDKEHIWFTELGTNKPRKEIMEALIQEALHYAARIYIHELPDTQGYGYVNMGTYKPEIDFYTIQYATQLHLPNPLTDFFHTGN